VVRKFVPKLVWRDSVACGPHAPLHPRSAT
jgi:hypothetical protein